MMHFRFQIQYQVLGRTPGVGASAHYLQLGNWGILLDAGLDPAGSGETMLPDFERIRNRPVNAIVISHAHLDHIGALPVAIRYFPHARIYMTSATAALAEPLLFHYLKVQRRKALEEKVAFQPPYSEQEVEQLLYLMQSFQYNFPFRIHGFQESEIVLTFWDAGHILGSAGVEIAWKERRIFYTGNTRKSAQFILRGARYPQSTEILMTEATYGADAEAERVTRAQEVRRFATFLKERIRFNGSVLIPVFALGRTQEVLVLLHQLIQKNRIPLANIYVTGFGIEMNRVYDRLLHKVYPDYAPRQIRAIAAAALRGKRFRAPAIILATSGMMWPNTLSYEIARDFLQDARNGIAFVGWADPETPGGMLRQGKIERIKQLFGVDEIHCRVEVFRFSAHSHREELLQMVRQMQPKQVILHHGEAPALNWMRDAIEKRGLSENVLIPQSGIFYQL